MTGFAELHLPHKVLQALTRMQFTTPTPIQTQTIPHVLAGRDILGSAQTGTGKTGAFGIPLMAMLMEHPEKSMLVLTPTRELATQVMAALAQMIPVAEVKTALLIGGEAMPKQMHQLKRIPRLIVGTPGRINDHLARKSLNLSNVGYLVLDETDRMLDMGFGVQIEKILGFIPKDRQTLMFSATLPQGIIKLSSKYLNNPVRVAVGSTTTPAAKIKQEVITTSESDKYKHLLSQLEKRTGSVIVFVKTKHGADRLAERLARAEYTADALHGDLQQRKREKVIQSYRDEKFRVLVATDVAARGLDIPHIAHVINYDLPQVPEDYIHRIGRTARAGAEGEAVNLLTPADGAKWKAIQRLIAGDDNTMPQQKSGGRSFGGGQSRDGGRERKGKWAGRPSGARSDRSESREPRFESRADSGSETRTSRGEVKTGFAARGDRVQPRREGQGGRKFDRSGSAPVRPNDDRPDRTRSDRSETRSSEGRPARAWSKSPPRFEGNSSEGRPARNWSGPRNGRTSSENGSSRSEPRQDSRGENRGEGRSETRSSEGRPARTWSKERPASRFDGNSSDARPARKWSGEKKTGARSDNARSEPRFESRGDARPQSRDGNAKPARTWSSAKKFGDKKPSGFAGKKVYNAK